MTVTVKSAWRTSPRIRKWNCEAIDFGTSNGIPLY